ncbi:MAG TPA: DNA-binding protein [Cytophagales bacterium]|nr:DNA-binding protein [Cytophagales bacterium]
MAKSQETFNKKEAEKKRLKKKQDKEHKKLERKANAKNGHNLDEMLAYVDEFGNITSTPPDPKRRKLENKLEDISIGTAKQSDERKSNLRTGIVSFFNESKGFGFIKDSETQESIFVHVNGLIDKIKENNKVTFEVEMGPKGLNATKARLA